MTRNHPATSTMKAMPPEDTDFDSELIVPTPRRKTSVNKSQTTHLLFENMQETETSSGKVVVKPRITPSPAMREILDFLARPGPNVIVKATAGSGKTTLLELISEQMIALHLLDEDRAAFLAYSKAIVKELLERLPLELDIRTVNSLGHLTVVDHCPKIPFHPNKYQHLCKQVIAGRNYTPKVRAEMNERLMSAVTLSMSNLLTPGVDFSHWQHTMLEFDLQVEDTDNDLYSMTFEVIKHGMNLLIRPEERSDPLPDGWHPAQDGKKHSKVVELDWVMSYLDQVYAPFFYNWKLSEPFKYLLIDEGQDLSFAQMNLIVAATDEHSRIVIVGDPSQSIYNFNGSLASSIDDLQYYLNATVMPLSVTYRCPTSHVAFAHQFTDQIEAAPGAIQGELADITAETMLEQLRPGDMILCRTNAPLIRWSYLLARRGVANHINGVDVGAKIVRLIKEILTWDGQVSHVEKFEGDSVIMYKETVDKMRDYLRHQLTLIRDSAARNGKSPDLKLAEAEDKMVSLKMVLDERQPTTAEELIKQVRALFSDRNEGVILSTMHRAKGLETQNVYVVEPQLLPHPKAKSKQALLTERAVQFVAATRAKYGLYFVDAPTPVVPAELATRPMPERPSEDT